MSIPKNYVEFQKTLTAAIPPNDWPDALRAMWHDAKEDWYSAHEIAQDIPTDMGSWIHGYLHIKEGDEPNARYWYNRAKRKFPDHGLEEENRRIIEEIISAR